jgi:glycerophosphoryl diester phosphodiesterase
MTLEKKDILIIGHKGANAIAPENTLMAFKKAIELKADMVEFDIYKTKDGEIVIIHDSDTLSTTGVHGLIKDMTLEEIKKLDAGEGEKIPTLLELIKIAKEKVCLQIEIKSTGLLEELIKIMKEENLINSSIVSSFIFGELVKLKNLEPKIKLGVLFSTDLVRVPQIKRKILKAVEKKFYAIHLNYNIADKEIVDFAHDNNLKVNVWTVNDKDVMERLIEMGVDGIITDDISMANGLLGRVT